MCLVETQIERSLSSGSFTAIRQCRLRVCRPQFCGFGPPGTEGNEDSVKQFKADIEAALDDARERGIDLKELDEYASKRLANYSTARFAIVSDHVVKVFVVIGCLILSRLDDSGGKAGAQHWLV